MTILKNLINNIISFKRTRFPHKKKMSKLIFIKNYDNNIEEYSAAINSNATITYTLYTTLDKNHYLDVFISYKKTIIFFENHIIDKERNDIFIFLKIRDSISEALFLYSYYYGKYDEKSLDFIALASDKLMEYKGLAKDSFPDNITYYYTEIPCNQNGYFILKNNKSIDNEKSQYELFEVLNINNNPVLKDQNDYQSVHYLYNKSGYYYDSLNIIKKISEELKEGTFDCCFEFLVFSNIIRITIHHSYINDNPAPPKNFILNFMVEDNLIKVFDKNSNVINQFANENNVIKSKYNDGRTFLENVNKNLILVDWVSEIIKTECYTNFIKKNILDELDFKIPLSEDEIQYIKMIDY